MRNALEGRARARAAAVALLAVLGLLAGCSHVTLISPYDEATDQGITAIYGKLDGLLTRLDADPVPAYASEKPSYEAIRAELASLRLRNEARPKNDLTTQQLEELRIVLAKLEELHRGGALNRAMIGPSRDALERTCRAILKLELAKKEAIE